VIKSKLAALAEKRTWNVPLYEYECAKCGKHFEKIEKFEGPYLKKCPSCGGKVERLLSAPAIQFKGTGWYVTDYAKSSSSGGDKQSTAEPAAAGGAKNDGKAESKSDKTAASSKEKKKPAAKEK